MILKPIAFVAMPFGKKRKGRIEIDFDTIYEQAVKPAALSSDVEIIRADEERTGGFIHGQMYERLLLAEIVIADLTLANPNVFYELGIRHCARPKSTILIFASETKLPFDVAPLRAIHYNLENGVLSQKSAEELKRNIEQKIIDAKKDTSTPDSPIFQLVQQFPGVSLPHEVTESFRDRVLYIDGIRLKLERARNIHPSSEALLNIKSIENEIGDFNIAPPELLIDLLLSYRDVYSRDAPSWTEMIRVTDLFPSKVKNIITVQEQLALALNRRNWNDDRDKAIRILTKLITEHGDSPETCGIIGCVYKDIYWNAKQNGNNAVARAALDKAIDYYRRGFEEDPRDYYPGINALTLLFYKGGDAADIQFKQLYPLVKFAIGRRGGLGSDDYWDLATVLELAILGRDWILARKTTDKLIMCGKAAWNFETTNNNLKFIIERFRENGVDANEFESIRLDIENKQKELEKSSQ